MKKILALIVLTGALATSSVFGQGYFKFASGKSQVWDGFSTAGLSTRSTAVTVALFWANSSTASPFAAWLANTPTTGNSLTTEAYSASQAWTALSAASAWTLAQTTDAGMNGNVQGVSTSTGAVTFGTGANFGITGTATATTYALMLVSFQTGSFGSGAIGWSAPVNVLSGSSLLDNTVASPTFTQFGTFVPSVPEPSTMALAALGGASLLLFRRRK